MSSITIVTPSSVQDVVDPSSASAATSTTGTTACPLQRFQREASRVTDLDEECIITISGRRFNVTAYGHAHPGGAKVLMKFKSKDATKAFEAAGHSVDAYEVLEQYYIDDDGDDNHNNNNKSPNGESATSAAAANTAAPARQSFKSRLRKKLFTREDPIGVHKYLGVFCLLNFIGRFYQMYFGDPAAGLGTAGHPYFSFMCLFPHALLSLSSLIFHTVPRSRVVGKPMIWQEYRVHNIIFGMRSVLTAMAAGLAIKFGNTPTVRFVAIVFSSACVLLSQYGADQATERLREVEVESTTATMPYWEGCSIETQRRFKSFYAYSQFMATLACLAVGNPAWPLSVLLAIQMASLLMTLVRKGLLSAKGYHIGYTISLILPYFVGLRSMAYSGSLELPVMFAVAAGMYRLRRRGVAKYALWIPVILARLFVGDSILSSFPVW
jgi:cytochrome b5